MWLYDTKWGTLHTSSMCLANFAIPADDLDTECGDAVFILITGISVYNGKSFNEGLR